MKYYVLRSRKTGGLIAGTDRTHAPVRQLFATPYFPPLLIPAFPDCLDVELQARGINPEDVEIDVAEFEDLCASDFN